MSNDLDPNSTSLPPPTAPTTNNSTIPNSAATMANLNLSSPQSSASLQPVIPLAIPIATKLTQSNFLTWKSQILPLINGSYPTILNSSGQVQFNPDYLPWSRQDQLILGWLRSSLTETIQSQVVSCATTVELWSTLHKHFSSTFRSRLVDLKRQLQSTSKGSRSCSEFLQSIRQIADELCFIGASPSDDDLILAVLNGLGPEYNAFVAAVTATSRHEPLALSDLHGMLLGHEALIQSQLAAYLTASPAAFYSGPRQQQWGGNGRSSHRASSSSRLYFPPKPNSSSLAHGTYSHNSTSRPCFLHLLPLSPM